MSKRNFILLIIILVIILALFFVFLSLQKNTGPSGNTEPGTNFISQFNPFASNTKPTTTPNNATPPANISGYQPNPLPEANAKLKKISSMPIAGFAVFVKERLKAPTSEGVGVPTSPAASSENVGNIKSKTAKKPTPPPTEFMPALRYVERATGNVYQTFADKIEERKFSTTVIPKIYEAYWGSKGESVIMRYLKEDGRTIVTFVGSLPKELLGGDTTGNNEIKGSFLPENITDLSVSPDAGSVFYLFYVGDNIVGTTFNLLNNKKVQIFDSPFTEWLPLWPNSKIITLTTKPSFGSPGQMYAIDPSTKVLNRVLGGINGLTTLMSPSGKLVLYSNNNLSLNVYHVDTKVSDPLGIRTLAEKCVWGKLSDFVYCAAPKTVDVGQYPDTWYQGEVSFTDQIWKVDIKTGNATIILDPTTESGGGEIDGIKLAVDDGENYLFFINKKDSFLWELSLK